MQQIKLSRYFRRLVAGSLLLVVPVLRADSIIYVSEFSSSGRILAYTAPSTYTVFAAGLNNPTGLAVDGSGNVFVTLEGTQTIAKYSSSGGLLATISTGADFTPRSVAVDSQGNIYTTSIGSRLREYNSAGELVRTNWDGISYGINCYSVAVDSSDNFYAAIAEHGIGTTLAKYSSSGALLNTITNHMDNIDDMTVANSGTVYVLKNNMVMEYDPSGTSLSNITISADAQYLAVDDSGHLFTTIFPSRNSSVIYEYGPSGDYLDTLATTYTSYGLVLYPNAPISPVPEPSPLALLVSSALGTIGYAVVKRRKRSCTVAG